jgi:hypothetical protein
VFSYNWVTAAAAAAGAAVAAAAAACVGVGLVFPTQLGRLEAKYCWVLTSQVFQLLLLLLLLLV